METDRQTGRNVARVMPDATALKALAHPVRLRMLGILRIEGPATATQLAVRLGLNSGATSYHLRQLALHGFIEEAASTSKRDRWWRSRHEVTAVLPSGAKGEELETGLAFSQAALAWQTGQMQQALEGYGALTPEWRAASTASDYTIPLTAGQAEALTKRLSAVIEEAMQAAPALGTALPVGVVPFTVVLHAFPYAGERQG